MKHLIQPTLLFSIIAGCAGPAGVAPENKYLEIRSCTLDDKVLSRSDRLSVNTADCDWVSFKGPLSISAGKNIIIKNAKDFVVFGALTIDGCENANYEGFTNSINGWYEEPLHYSIGFVGSPIFAKLRTKDPMVGFAEEVQLVHLGIEAKGFLKPKLVPGFLRLGFYQATLTSYGDAGRLDGRSFLWGLGYEFKMFGVGLAPEMSWRHGSLDDGFTFSGTAPCIGVHFYDAL